MHAQHAIIIYTHTHSTDTYDRRKFTYSIFSSFRVYVYIIYDKSLLLQFKEASERSPLLARTRIYIFAPFRFVPRKKTHYTRTRVVLGKRLRDTSHDRFPKAADCNAVVVLYKRERERENARRSPVLFPRHLFTTTTVFTHPLDRIIHEIMEFKQIVTDTILYYIYIYTYLYKSYP